MSRKRRSEKDVFATVVALPATSLSSSSATVSLKLVATTSPRRYGPWPDNARRNAEENWLAYQRGKQYRTEKQAQGAPVGNNNRAIQRGNESQKPCPFEKTAEKIAAVAGVSLRTIKNDANFAEAIELFRRSVLHNRFSLAVGELTTEPGFISGDLAGFLPRFSLWIIIHKLTLHLILITPPPIAEFRLDRQADSDPLAGATPP